MSADHAVVEDLTGQVEPSVAPEREEQRLLDDLALGCGAADGRERGRVLEIRSAGTVPSEVVRQVLAMLDVEESVLLTATAERARVISSTGLRQSGADCVHLRAAPVVVTTGTACEECLADGRSWVSLRECLACGHTGCCDSSAGQHATAHFHATGHPVIQSAEADEDWRWCYLDHTTA
ncbi:UBP-type zinc finger domain-containing protein [Nocardioides jejuensis]|uniref:UBP-type domain-containing protein n=1 Tax=Nocardioides jejuensis TaxID=2502782 RepID=A0A4R1BWN0_9ACTN|nr:UBP-type zinc finger domain-containing protein [Nocardioides jejuensis]TCJ22168.1 hypothetical protein EPD65_13410 [Nocardioides jejuensis]